MLDPVYEDIGLIENPALAAYAAIYRQVYRNFLEQVKASGMVLGEPEQEQTAQRLGRLRKLGIVFRNGDKSLYLNRISPACRACRTGAGSVTMFISLQCPRHCFFCFNPNQEGYEYYLHHHRDCVGELRKLQRGKAQISYLALSGGEPLLHSDEVAEFFHYAQKEFPRAHTRLYTAGDLLTPEMLGALQKSGLREIRFSIKMDDPVDTYQKILERIALARGFVPTVMVEMPVLPGSLAGMKKILLDLDELRISGINLLELCYPFYNAEEFRRRGYSVKNPPYRVLYDYWYAGGLPISGSELESLELLEFAARHKLKLGIHYCSLENKQTGQIYQQNHGRKVADYLYFSPNDYFFKSAKVFGADIPVTKEILRRAAGCDGVYNEEYDFLEFHVRHLACLTENNPEVALSFNVIETRADGEYLRELGIALARPRALGDLTKL